MALTKKILIETVGDLLKELKVSFEAEFKSIDQRFERIETLLVSHDNTLKTLITRDEFNVFRMENLDAHANLATSIEKLDQEFTVFTVAHDRLEQRVGKHEKALIKHKILALDAR